MKKFALLVLLTGVVTVPMTVLADPTPILLNFVCPNTTGTGTNSLSNFGDSRIAGYGTLMVDTNPGRPPYFTYAIPAGAHIPSKINTGNYTNNGTDYDPDNAIISCSYVSPTFDPFTVSYQLTNGVGGTINSQTANSISINQYVGFALH